MPFRYCHWLAASHFADDFSTPALHTADDLRHATADTIIDALY